MQSPTLKLTKELIRCASVTPNDAGCQSLLADRLHSLGFHIEQMPFDKVNNLWARYGNSAPLLIFVGHTDVVPPGPLEQWKSPPFEPTCRDGYLYGRGAADMKGALAAFVNAVEIYLNEKQSLKRGSIAFLITADEEGPAINGTRKVIEQLVARGEVIDYCLVGEPTSDKNLGDTIKNGRRGSLHGQLTIKGIQGHIAYPHLAKNPIHLLAPLLFELTHTIWDQGDKYFPPTSWQISNIHGGTGATNVIPGSVELLFNFRFSPASTEESLRTRMHAILDRHKLDYHIAWNLSGYPYFTPSAALIRALSNAINQVTGIEPKLSTTGGTSDGRYIAPHCPQVIEFGPLNATIHKIDECIALADLDNLTAIYYHFLCHLFK